MGDRKDRYKPFNELNKPITSTLLPCFIRFVLCLIKAKGETALKLRVKNT